jgi:hypothetical protein
MSSKRHRRYNRRHNSDISDIDTSQQSCSCEVCSIKNLPTLPVLRATGSVELTTDTPLERITYSLIVGDPEFYFDPSIGVFTALKSGVYQFSISVTFSPITPTTARIDGERYVRLVRRTESGIENSLVGGYHVVSNINPNFRNQPKNTIISFTNTSILCIGESVWLRLYFNTTNTTIQRLKAYIEFVIIRQSLIDRSIFCNPSTNLISTIGPTGDI